MFLYKFSKNKTEKTFLDVKVFMELDDQNTCSFKLPSWRPGRYELQNFSQNVRDFTAKSSNGKLLKVFKEDKDTWIVDSKGVHQLEISYSYYARQMDAGGTWVDDEQWYINFITCAMLVNGQVDIPCEVRLENPKDWKVACSMVKTANGLLAKNFYELVDSPLIASSNLQHLDYTVQETHFHLWFQGEISLQSDKIIEGFTNFTKVQIALFGSFPTKEYHFLFQILPYGHYHGVEHAHSTVITLGPHYDFYSEKMYNDFLGVSSHELFHTWNVTRLRPKEMVPYDFFNENYFNTGFIAEGITTYYGDYMLKKSGVFSEEQYLKEINNLLNRHFSNEGRKHASLVDSSVELWLDGYKKGIPGRKVSIYVEGALAALILDLTLRLESNGKTSLDDVIKLLWKRHANGGYSFEQYITCVNEIAGKDMQAYFDEFIEGKFSAEESLNHLLPKFGFLLQEKPSTNVEESRFGIKLQWQNSVLKVTEVDGNSAAAGVLERNDEIIALDGIKPEKKFGSMFNRDAVKIHFFSNSKLKEATLKANDKKYFAIYEIIEDANADEMAKEFKKAWLG